MNAAARVLEQTHHLEGRLGSILLTGRLVWILMLLVLVLSSAFAVVYERNVYHNTVTQSQGLQQANHEMRIKAKQLWLEQSVWAAPERIQNKAVSELGMVTPTNRAVVMSKS